MKDIVIIANFCRDFSETDNGRFMYLCKELSKSHNVEIITSSFYHGGKNQRESLEIEWPFTITFLHEIGYKKNISFKRFFSHYMWGNEVKKYLEKRKKPDVIYCAIPSLTGPLAAARYCEKNKVKFIIDIQDLWPEAFKMVFNPPILGGLIYAPFKVIADNIYSRADAICAVSTTYVNRALAANRNCKKHKVVFLGTFLDTFDEFVKNNYVKRDDDDLWLGYCGTLGASYDLTCVFDALYILKSKNIKVPKFVIMGTGPRKEEFEQYAKSKKIDVVFTDVLSYPKMCGLLSSCDMVVNPITHGAAQSIINKHGDYASAGLPVLSTQECQEYIDLVNLYEMGFNCKNNDADDLAEKILLLVQDEKLRSKMGKNARKCAEERFDRKVTYSQIISLILED